MKNMKTLATVLSAFLLSVGAFASDGGTSAAGTPETGGGYGGVVGCTYSYMIQKIGQTFAERGETVTYHVFVKNTGTCRLREIDVRDILPRRLTFISATPTPTRIDERRLVWENIELKAGRFVDFQITAKIDSNFDRDDNRVISNTACTYNRRIGVRICDSSSMTVFRDDETIQ